MVETKLWQRCGKEGFMAFVSHCYASLIELKRIRKQKVLSDCQGGLWLKQLDEHP